MRPPKYNVSIFFINWRNVIRYTWLPSRRSSLLYIKNQLDTSLKLKPVAELWKIYKKALRQGRTFGDEGGSGDLLLSSLYVYDGGDLYVVLYVEVGL